jgi:hypothetical protein
MSMNDTDQYDPSDDTDGTHDDNLRELREAAKGGKAAKAEAEGLRRDLAFAKAGIDIDTPKGKMFAKSYEGDLSAADIKAGFEDIFGAPTAEAPTPAADDTDEAARREALRQQTQEHRDLTAAGSEQTPPPAADLVKEGYAKFEEALSAGKPRELAFKEILSGHIGGANAGQKNATWTGWTDEQLDGWQ